MEMEQKKNFIFSQLRQFKKEFQDSEFATLYDPLSIKENFHFSQIAIPYNFVKMIENQPPFTLRNFLNQIIAISVQLSFQESLDYVIKGLKEQGLFYGVLEFSQGSAVAARLVTFLVDKEMDIGYE